MNGLLKFITGKKTAPVTMLIGLIFAGLAFTVFNTEATETTPGTGLPETAESVQVAKLRMSFQAPMHRLHSLSTPPNRSSPRSS